jgi:hypothetical protein
VDSEPSDLPSGSIASAFKRQGGRLKPTGAVGRWLVVAAATLVIACSGPSLPGSATSEAITPATAQAIVRDYWKMSEQASMHQDAKLFSRIETGFLKESDEASIKVDLAFGNPGLSAPRPLRHVTVYVPHQRGYPAEFTVLIETVQLDATRTPTDAPLSLYEHFIQPSSHDSWKADFYAQINTSRHFNFALDSAGYAAALPVGDSRFVLRPDRLATAFAAYQRTGLQSGSASGPFADGPMTTDSVGLQRAHHDTLTLLGYQEATDFRALPFVHAYRAADGGAIVLFALRPSNTVTLPDPSSCIVQPASLRQWGGLVPAGKYASVTIENLLQYIAANPSAGPGAKVDVVGVGDDQVAARTVPSPLPQCQ